LKKSITINSPRRKTFVTADTFVLPFEVVKLGRRIKSEGGDLTNPQPAAVDLVRDFLQRWNAYKLTNEEQAQRQIHELLNGDAKKKKLVGNTLLKKVQPCMNSVEESDSCWIIYGDLVSRLVPEMHDK
jgi:hypothetical protein